MASSATWPCAALREAELAPRTTLRVGGPAEWLLEPAHPDELVEAWCAARERGLAVHVLGGGANLLIGDEGVRGVVISTERLGRVFRPHRHEAGSYVEPGAAAAPVERPFDPEEPPVLVVWAGAPLPGLCRTARDLGWSGLEGLVGVPGHLGGGVTMNAGGRWGELWDVIESVRVLEPDGTPRDLARAECTPRYRDGNLGGRTVLGAVLRLERGSKAEIMERMAQYLAEKAAAQPVTERSSGCVFKNPDPELSDGRTAGQLVEAAGAKGLAVGGARVSEKHGNFIVNAGGARAADVIALIERVRERVAERCGVRLESEVKRWGVAGG